MRFTNLVCVNTWNPNGFRPSTRRMHDVRYVGAPWVIQNLCNDIGQVTFRIMSRPALHRVSWTNLKTFGSPATTSYPPFVAMDTIII